MNLTMILIYRTLLIGALMFTVGYLGWSAWWLLLLLTSPIWTERSQRRTEMKTEREVITKEKDMNVIRDSLAFNTALYELEARGKEIEYLKSYIEEQKESFATMMSASKEKDAEIEQLNAKVAMLTKTGLEYVDEINNENQTLFEYERTKHNFVEALSATEQDVTRFTNSIRDDAYQLGGKHMIELLEEGYGFDFEPAGLNASIKHQLSLPYENKITIRKRRGEHD